MDSSKSPFDDPQFSGPDESAGNNPSSATGIFNKVSSPSTPSPQEDDWLKSLLRAETPASGQRNVEAAAAQPLPQAVSEVAPTPVLPANSPGSFTRMFQQAKTENAPPVRTENIPSAPVTTPPAKSAADLTSVFTPISLGKPAVAIPGQAASAIPPEPKPGEFTQLLRTLNNPVQKTESEAVLPPVVETSKPSEGAGSFTQLFKTPLAQRTPPERDFVPPPAAAPAQASGPGAFTQMFQSLSSVPSKKDEPESANPDSSTPAASTAPAPLQPAAGGGFTQMFQSLSPKMELAPKPPSEVPAVFEPPIAQPKSGPGSFTQMFSQISGQSAGQEDPLASLKQEPMPPSHLQFSTPTPPPTANPFRTGTPRTDSGPSAQGGFTQLFQALGTENAPAAIEPPPLMPPAPVANPAPSAVGGFTQLLRTLNADPTPPQAASQPMAVSSAPPAPVSSNGPGEFTRIISGSMLREAQGQSVVPGSPTTPPVGPSAGGGQPGFSMPPMQMPQPPAFPKMPSGIPPMHAGGGGAAPQMPQFQQPPFAFPPAPVPAAPQPPAPSKLQQYLPLILVVNVFVLIVVILIVVFALRHH